MSHGHVGAVKFITSVEIAKNQSNNSQAATSSSTNDSNSSREFATVNYKTVVITGGQGYEEYKTTTNASGVLIGNSGVNALPANSNSGAENSTTNTMSSSSSNATSGSNQGQGLITSQSSPVFNSTPVNTNTSGGNSNSAGILPSNIQPNIPYFFSSLSNDETNLGKEDLINYVLTWEI